MTSPWSASDSVRSGSRWKTRALEEDFTMARTLSAEDLLAGAGTLYTVEIPARVLEPEGTSTEGGQVELRPLTVRDLQRITQAAKEQQVLTSVLMVQQALVRPRLSVEQAGALPAGVVQFLLQKV